MLIDRKVSPLIVYRQKSLADHSSSTEKYHRLYSASTEKSRRLLFFSSAEISIFDRVGAPYYRASKIWRHYRASKYYEQTGSEPSTALFSPARSSSTSWVPTYYTPLVKPIHGLISTFSPVGRLLGTSRPNTLAWGHGSQSGSFLIWRHYRASK